MWHDAAHEPAYSEYLELDLSTVVPSIAGPKRPQDRILLSESKIAFRKDIHNYVEEQLPRRAQQARRGRRGVLPGVRSRRPLLRRRRRCRRAVGRQRRRGPSHQAGQGELRRARRLRPRSRRRRGRGYHLLHQHLEPVGHVGRRAPGSQRGREGPVHQAVGQDQHGSGSQVVNDYYEKAGLWPYLEKLGFYLGGFGCTTCIGNTGPLPEEISKAVNDNDLSVTAVLSGNRNFEGRISPRRQDELPGVPARWSSRTRSRARWTSTSTTTRWARTRTATTCS